MRALERPVCESACTFSLLISNSSLVVSNPDERHQALAVLLAGAALCLWLSHFLATRWPDLPGTVDLNRWIKVWNRPLTTNWLVALLLFLFGLVIARQIRRAMLIASLRQQQREARSLGRSLDGPAQTTMRPDDYRPIE